MTYVNIHQSKYLVTDGLSQILNPFRFLQDDEWKAENKEQLA